MCGRYATTRSAADLAALFEAVDEAGGEAVDGAGGEVAPRYNVAPTDRVPVVRHSRRVGGRVVSLGHWGLLPAWVRDPRAAAKMINARSETVATSRAYAAAFASRRALVPADGWYEWRRDGPVRQAYFLTPADGSVLALAGLWTRWGTGGRLTFCVVTTAATGELARVHDRMPLLVPAQQWREWLTGPSGPSLLRPPPADLLEALEVRPVGPAVGDVRKDGPALVARMEPARSPDRLW